jgi:hypothetical protein
MDVLHLAGTLQHCSTGLDLTFCLGVVSMLGAELSMERPGFLDWKSWFWLDLTS